MSKKYYQLKDQDTSFHDPQTGLTLRRDEAVEVSAPLGEKTVQAIEKGRLVPADGPKPPPGAPADDGEDGVEKAPAKTATKSSAKGGK